MKLFDYVGINVEKASAILDIGTTYEQLATLVTPDLDAGTYMIAISWEANFNGQKNQPMITQLTGTYAGSSEWYDSVGDGDDGVKTRYYAFPKVWPGGVITLGLQGKKDSSFTADLDVDFLDLMVFRVG